MMSLVGYLLKDLDFFNFHLSGSALSVSKQPIQLIIAAHNCHIGHNL